MNRINFDESDWERIERDAMAWWNGDLHRPLVFLSSTDPVEKPAPFSFHSNYGLDISASEIVDHYEQQIAATHYYGDAFPWIWSNFGPGIAAGFMGAKVNSVYEPGETVWFTPSRLIPISELHPEYDPNNAWWNRVKDITREFVNRFEGRLQVSLTDLGGNLDLLASLITTEQLLLDVIDQPDEVRRVVDLITSLWIRYYQELDEIIRPTCRGTSSWAPIWSTGRTYMLQCDFSYMISPKMFEQFVMPDLTACCDYLDHAFYHLDGKGEIPHLDLLLSLERLRGIQWIPGDGQPPADQWLPLLKRIRNGGKLCQVFVTPAGARHIVRNIGGKGFLFVISHDQNEFHDPEDAHAFISTLASEDISQQ